MNSVMSSLLLSDHDGSESSDRVETRCASSLVFVHYEQCVPVAAVGLL